MWLLELKVVTVHASHLSVSARRTVRQVERVRLYSRSTPHIHIKEVRRVSHEYSEGYTFAWPIYQTSLRLPWAIGSDEEEAVRDRKDRSVAPVNNRYRRRVSQLVSWREVLEANGYRVIDRNRVIFLHHEPQKLAGIRHDKVNGEVFYIHCVFHQERTSSLCLGSWGFQCYGCGSHGSLVDFVAGINHLKSARAIKQYFAATFPQMQPRTE